MAGDFATAETHAQASFGQYEKTLPKGHWVIATAMSVLGEIRMRRGDHAGARQLLEAALARLRPGSVQRRNTLERLVELHESRSEPQLAAKYRKELKVR